MTFENLLKKCSATIYPEEVDEYHKWLSGAGVSWLKGKLSPGSRVLDIGIGNGYAMEQMAKSGLVPYGISLNPDEVKAAHEKGYSAELLDMHDISIAMGKFDGVFARHVLEHSPCPLLVLNNICELLNDGGWLFVEVPAPETASHHQTNKNHYSVLTMGGWVELIKRAGFDNPSIGSSPLAVPAGPDTYFVFLAQKSKANEKHTTD